jgi:hypothetical protein
VKCFYHHEQDAVGGCKSCGKGLCPECAVDLGKGLACSGRCEAQVRALIALIDQNAETAGKTVRLLRSARQTHFWTAALYIALGAGFASWGLLSEEMLGFAVVLGGLFLVYGLFSITSALRLPRFESVPSSTMQAEPKPQ